MGVSENLKRGVTEPFVKSKCTKKQKYFYEARMRAISSRKSCSEHR